MATFEPIGVVPDDAFDEVGHDPNAGGDVFRVEARRHQRGRSIPEDRVHPASRRQDVVPIPGTKRARYVEQNVVAAFVDLTAADLATLEERIPADAASGERYTAEGIKGVDA